MYGQNKGKTMNPKESKAKYSKEILAKESATLRSCPFCGGECKFITNRSEQIIIQHFPDSGVICPVRYEQYCESFDQGRLWWNIRLGN